MTLVGFLPSCVDTLRRPTVSRFLCCLTVCACSFFLFSWQVHEKTILYPLLPFILLFCEHGTLVSWGGALAAFR